MESKILVAEIERWLFERALPFWADRGVDRRFGGFVEELEFDGRDAARSFKRTRVAGRQVYVFAHASLLGWKEGLGLVDIGGVWMTKRAWTGDCFARSLTREGDILDPTPDLYDHAFALLGFAWAYRATQDKLWASWTERTHEAIIRKFGGGIFDEGFAHQIPPQGWRLQNPHMHLLEACLAAFEATGEESYQRTAQQIVDLFKGRFFQSSTGTLAEFYDERWNPATGAEGEIREPGHHYEWAWLLWQSKKTLGSDLSAFAAALCDSMEPMGINQRDGAVRDLITASSQTIKGGSRTWPNTERMKAAIALAEMKADGAALPSALDPQKMLVGSANLILHRYLKGAPEISIPAGGWIDAFDEFGRPTARTMPASTFYHLFVAFAEALRFLK
jgi:N-acylglucosamine 2-epimerase/mannose-6-phosphate isomerase